MRPHVAMAPASHSHLSLFRYFHLPANTRRVRTWLLARVEKLFESQLNSLLANDNYLSITLRSRIQENQKPPSSHNTELISTVESRTFHFPGKSEQEAWRFSQLIVRRFLPSISTNLPLAVVLRILELIHEALINKIILTKRCIFNRRPLINGLDLQAFRDIYYRDPALFSKQSVVDRYVDDLACTFGVPRSLLNVVRK